MEKYEKENMINDLQSVIKSCHRDNISIDE
jgi:hypothetical protein